MSADATMTGTATITFSQTGVQPPVYVVSSLGGWATLEMDIEDAQTASGNLIFTKQFGNVAEGSHQYKIRIGEGHWVVDESKESATDEHGNRNNVVHVTPASHANPASSITNTTTNKEVTSDQAQHGTPSEPSDGRQDATVDSSHASELPSIPVPLVVVEKVADQDQPEYGDVEPESLPSDAAKRTADAEPDFEAVNADAPVPLDQPQSPEIPLLVVEKTDDEPAYGDDFGENATVAQKVAHDLRAADASPDQLVISPDHHTELRAEGEAAPPSEHGPIQADNPSLASSLETMEDESVQSSTEQTSSSEVINTPSEPDDSQDDELSQGPLLPHENVLVDTHDELENGLDNEDVDELEHGPLLSHETGFNHDSGLASDVASDEEDEFDRAPLLSHETGFSNYKGSEITTNSGFLDDQDYMEPQHYGPYGDEDEGIEARSFEPDEAPTFSHEDNDGDEDLLDGDQDESPLLPHERDSAVVSNAGSDMSADDAHYMLHDRPTLGYETDNAQELFSGSGRPNFFRKRTNSSTLPHKMPRSDAEDENLDDPSLERFPTSREQILERVATIGLQLPEDETVEDNVHSPQLSVLSQACSSVDLVPVKSYTSLASVPEADDSEEEDQDVDSLPSPIALNGARPSAFSRDPHATPMPDDGKQLAFTEANAHSPSARTTETSEAESVDKHDGAKDSTNILSTLREAIATPTNILNPMTPPLTPESKTTSSDREGGPSAPQLQLRQRRVRTDDSTETPQASTAIFEDTNEKDKTTRTVAPKLAQQPTRQNENFFQNFTRIVYGSIASFFAACAGDRKRASTTVLVAGVAVTTYYLLASTS